MIRKYFESLYAIKRSKLFPYKKPKTMAETMTRLAYEMYLDGRM